MGGKVKRPAHSSIQAKSFGQIKNFGPKPWADNLSAGVLGLQLQQVVEKGFSTACGALSVISPKGERTKGSQLFRRVLKPQVVETLSSMLFQHLLEMQHEADIAQTHFTAITYEGGTLDLLIVDVAAVS